MEVLDRTAGEAQLFPARSIDPQPVAQSAERRSVGSHEPVDRLGADLAAFGPARPVEEDPHRGLTGFDLWIVAVLQHLDPRDHAFGKACLTCCSMRSVTALPILGPGHGRGPAG